MKATASPIAPKFRPIKLEIVFENQDELSLFNAAVSQSTTLETLFAQTYNLSDRETKLYREMMSKIHNAIKFMV